MRRHPRRRGRRSSLPSILDARAAFLTLPPPGYIGGCEGWELLSGAIRCQRGVVAVVPDPVPKSGGKILLPGGCASNNKPDVGTVVSSGVDELIFGDRVVYNPWQGAWFKPFRVGVYEVEELAMFGLNSPGIEDLVVMEPIEDVIPMRLAGSAFQMLGENVLIKRDAKKTQSGSFFLVDEDKDRTFKATVVASGPRAMGPDGERLEVGARVLYHGRSLVVGLKGIGERIEGLEDLSDHAIIKSRNLYAVLVEE